MELRGIPTCRVWKKRILVPSRALGLAREVRRVVSVGIQRYFRRGEWATVSEVK